MRPECSRSVIHERSQLGRKTSIFANSFYSPPLIRELIIDMAIEGIEDVDRPANSEEVSLRQLKIEKFKQQQWGDRAETLTRDSFTPVV